MAATAMPFTNSRKFDWLGLQRCAANITCCTRQGSPATSCLLKRRKRPSSRSTPSQLSAATCTFEALSAMGPPFHRDTAPNTLCRYLHFFPTGILPLSDSLDDLLYSEPTIGTVKRISTQTASSSKTRRDIQYEERRSTRSSRDRQPTGDPG